MLLSEIAVSFLTVQPLSLIAPLENALCLSLLDLVYAGRASKALSHILDENLLPALLQIKVDIARLQALSQDLQVRRTSFATTITNN